MASTPSATEQSTSTSQQARWLAGGLVLCLLTFYASVRTALPAVNEPHYLCKARHLWDATWCARDPFLQSANAHYVFYQTFGALTLWLPFEVVAGIGRGLGWAALAWGFSRWALLWDRRASYPLACCSVALCITIVLPWSGEWIVGGIEGKVLSYACLWLSLAAIAEKRLYSAALWSGFVTAWHPVIGLWHALCLIGGWLLPQVCWWQHRSHSVTGQPHSPSWQSQFQTALIGTVIWSLASAPGLVPAVLMLGHATPVEAYQADYIQVFFRLSHHLDPLRFPVLASSVLGCLWLWLTWRTWIRPTADARWNAWTRYVWCAGLVAVAGYVIRCAPLLAEWMLQQWPAARTVPGLDSLSAAERFVPRWLKYYPFRLFDALAPFYVATCLLSPISQWQVALRSQQRAWYYILVPGVLLGVCWLWPARDANPSRMTPDMLTDWQAACAYVRDQTPADALCVTTHRGWAFKWYAQRAEYLSRKDCPQDARGIIAWNQRLQAMARWSRTHAKHGYTPQSLAALREFTSADYFVTTAINAPKVVPVFENPSFQIYDLHALKSSTSQRAR